MEVIGGFLMPVDHIIEAVLDDVRAMPNVKDAVCLDCHWPNDTMMVVGVTFENVTEKRFGRNISAEARESLFGYIQMDYPSVIDWFECIFDNPSDCPVDQGYYALDFADKWQFPDCNYDLQVATSNLERVIRRTVDVNVILDKLESLIDTDVLAEALMELRDPVADNRGEYDKAVEEVHKAYEPYAKHKAKLEMAKDEKRYFDTEF